MRVLPVVISALFASGCAVWYGTRPPCPLSDLKSVAVLGIEGAPQGERERFGEILATELVQFPGIERIVRPRDARFVLSTRNLDRHEVKDLRELARALEVDGVLVADLYEFDMRDPPRAVIWCALILRRSTTREADYAFRLVRRGAVPHRSGDGANGVFSLTRVFDAGTHETADDLYSYSLSRESEVCGLGRTEYVKRIGSNFFRFVSERTIRDLFSLLKETGTDDRSKEYDRKKWNDRKKSDDGKFVYRQG